MSLRPKCKSWSRPLADLVSAAIDPVLARQGFGETAILLNWDEIVGPRIARACEPLKLQWPPRGPKSAPESAQPATLVVRVEGAFAVELQHQAPLVVERVNAHLGWRCIGKLALRQGPLERRRTEKRVVAAVDPAAAAEAARVVAGVGEDGLREALARLGARVLGG